MYEIGGSARGASFSIAEAVFLTVKAEKLYWFRIS